MHIAAKLWGVIVADVIASGSTERLRSVLGSRLRITTLVHLQEKRIRLPYAVTAGDEFQTVAGDLREIPGLLYDLRRRMRPLKLRIGIGIGEISGRLRPPVNQLAGPAFELARRAIQEAEEARLHSEVRTRFRSENEQFNLVLNLIYDLHDSLVGDLSEKQWKTVDAYLTKKRVDLAAKALRINASTVSRNLKRSHLRQSLDTIETAKKLIEFSFSGLHKNVSAKRIA